MEKLSKRLYYFFIVYFLIIFFYSARNSQLFFSPIRLTVTDYSNIQITPLRWYPWIILGYLIPLLSLILIVIIVKKKLPIIYSLLPIFDFFVFTIGYNLAFTYITVINNPESAFTILDNLMKYDIIFYAISLLSSIFMLGYIYFYGNKSFHVE